ncbi:HlyD family efflux transporter periplasmic adaptor subunit [Hespellia stercorisuis]|uniref:RND related barrel-sandwich hybrid domain-containing protein n=1 Tax=Hespellia stercorisuis DSM 15480 TaxID=1121950 RepID=A0A1M6N314_9FIRM|nr:HlyD family efflux transporter periplasmic adaptor subunit [Hespellia stercorisuis]SHJ90055.1 hypothetical protein SAMN02745243_01690 [Hespellia stercorisuis DSM 15480]
MAAKKNNSVNIKKYRNRQEINIGIFVFAIVFVYLVITLFTYLTSKRVSIYEVREGSILRNNTYTGLALRSESVVNTDSAGYITYFVSENSKVRNGENLYTVSKNKLDSETTTAKDVSLSTKEQSNIIRSIQSFNEGFNGTDFSKVHTLANEITNTLQKVTSQTKAAQLNAILASADASGINVTTAPTDGILSFNVDGYEDITIDNFTKKDLDSTTHESSSLEDGSQVSAGAPVCKLITDESWYVIVELDKDSAVELVNTTSVKTHLDNHTESVWANLSVVSKDGTNYAILSYDNSMIQYCSERFVNVELILEDQNGLKIPKTSVLKKDFYVIPSDYITYGGDSSASGVLKQVSGKGGASSSEFVEADIYYQTEDGMVYIDPELFKQGDVLIKPESGDTTALTERKRLRGAYNINKGYAIFRPVTVLCESDEYYIIDKSDSYSLSNYDHIVLDSSTVKEGEVVFQ